MSLFSASFIDNEVTCVSTCLCIKAALFNGILNAVYNNGYVEVVIVKNELLTVFEFNKNDVTGIIEVTVVENFFCFLFFLFGAVTKRNA